MSLYCWLFSPALAVLYRFALPLSYAKLSCSDPYKWSTDEVCKFLDAMQMSPYMNHFKAQEITGMC